MFLPAVIDVVILDVAVGAARVEHLALRVHRHGHNGAVVVPKGLQKSYQQMGPSIFDVNTEG